MGKFSDVPVEEDTKILSQSRTRVGDCDVLHQKWFWNGIHAEILVFPAEEVHTLDDWALEALVQTAAFVDNDSQFTIKCNAGGYTFVNFNFRS